MLESSSRVRAHVRALFLSLQVTLVMQAGLARTYMYSHAAQILAVQCGCRHAHTRARSFSLSRALSLSRGRMIAYAGVWSRIVEWLQFGDVRHDTALSLYPTIASFNTYRLPYTPIASLISDIGYARRISPPSYPIVSFISNIGYVDR